jgi:hypothetical protein
MDYNRKKWNDRHKELRNAMEKSGDRNKAIDLFLIQHAMLHSAKLSSATLFSFEDEILNDLSPESYRIIPANGNHSIAWIIWHLARIEDVIMNLLVADAPQILHKNRWHEKLQIPPKNTGNGMSDDEVLSLSIQIDIRELREYRLAVGRETRRIARKLKKTDFRKRVEPARLQRIWDERAMLPGGKGIVNYWANRTIAGLLLMPPTRHCFLHLNEARRIKARVVRK